MIPVTDDAPVAIDFETFYDKKAKISIKDMGAYKYLKTTDIYLVAIYDGEQTFVGHPLDFDWSSLRGRRKISHNRSFDLLAYKVLREKFPDQIEEMDTDDWLCTGDMAAYLKCKRALKDAVKILLHRDISKDVRNKMNGLTVDAMKELVMAANGKLYPITDFPEAIRPTLTTFYEQVCEYAGNDVRDCHELWMKFGHLFPERERRLSRMTTDQAHRGIYMDRAGLEQDAQMLQRVKDVARTHLPWAPEDVNDEEGILSIPKLGEYCRSEYGVEPPATTSEDTKTLREWERLHPNIRYTKAMRDYRKANILLRRIEHVLDRLMDNGRFPFAWLYAGAHTLRWAGGSGYSRGGTGETGFNVQNIPKEPMYIDHDYELITDLDEIKGCEAWDEGAPSEMLKPYLHAVDLRARVIAEPGKKLVIFDAAQIEPRIIKWLITLIFAGTQKAKDAQDDLDRVRAGESIYEVHGRKRMGWKGGNPKKEAPKEYFFWKQQVLGLGFGCGHVRYKDKCAEYHVEISLLESKAQVAGFRAKEQGITSLWGKLDTDFKSCQGKDYEVELPNGVIMTYFDVHAAIRSRFKKDKQAHENKALGPDTKRLEMAAYTERGGRIKWFYGALIFENIVQRIAREIMADMLLACDDRGWMSLFSVHDEGVLEVDNDVDLEDVRQTVSISPEWAEGLPIAVDIQESPHYLK